MKKQPMAREREAVKAAIEKFAAPQAAWSKKAHRRIEAEVRARWPYYQRLPEYRRLAKRHKQLWTEVGRLLPPTGEPPTDEEEFSKVCEQLERIDKTVFEQYGLLSVIELHYSAEDILEDLVLCRRFCPAIGQAAWCMVTENPPIEGKTSVDDQWRQRWLRSMADYFTVTVRTEKDYMVKYRELPIQLNLYAPKQEILAAVAEIVEAWQNRWKKTGLSFVQRDRPPDLALFPLYVKAVELSKQGYSTKEITWLLWPGHSEDKKSTAELYIRNGNLLLQGRSYLIGKQ